MCEHVTFKIVRKHSEFNQQFSENGKVAKSPAILSQASRPLFTSYHGEPSTTKTVAKTRTRSKMPIMFSSLPCGHWNIKPLVIIWAQFSVPLTKQRTWNNTRNDLHISNIERSRNLSLRSVSRRPLRTLEHQSAAAELFHLFLYAVSKIFYPFGRIITTTHVSNYQADTSARKWQ